MSFPNQIDTLWMVLRLFAVSTLWQSIEMLWLRAQWGENGPWRWSLVREDFRAWVFPLPRFLDLCLREGSFLWLLRLRVLASLWLFTAAAAPAAAFLCLSTLLIAWRWRGSFNGGSDAMTFLTGGAVTLALAIPRPKLVLACLWFLAIQLTLSYFTAGLVKVRQRAWWSGEAMAHLLRSSRYARNSRFLERVAARPGITRLLAWMTLGFEVLFPLAFVSPELARLFLAAGFAFHLMNVFVLGLNRFFWAWIAIYPALFYGVLLVNSAM